MLDSHWPLSTFAAAPERTASHLGFIDHLTGGEPCREDRGTETEQERGERGTEMERQRTNRDRSPCSETARNGVSSGRQRPALPYSALKCKRFTGENERKTEKKGRRGQ